MPLLHWLTREKDINVAVQAPYRLLEEIKEHSYGDPDSRNMLIQGDNLDALKTLLPYYAGKIKCIFIDPPYNTRSAFEHYDDNLEHAQWLAMMYPRLELLRDLLAEEGSIWVSIDDNEGHYLKVIMDEIFGRNNFFSNIVWQHSVQGKNDAKTVSLHHNHIMVYRKSDSFHRNTVERTEEHNKNYSNPDKDPKGKWRSGDVRSPNHRENLKYDVPTPSGKIISAPEKGWRWSQETFMDKVATGEITFINDDTRVLRKIYLADQTGRVPESLWFGDDVGTTREASSEIKNLGIFGFDTPKPERLIQRILQIATKDGELVLDSFLGSGTTAAVAQKMGRAYIGIEMGEHAITHCAPRLQKVIEGEQGGISEANGWKAGGGFRFYKLGVPVFDENGHVSPGIKFGPLAAHLWFVQTKVAYSGEANSPFLGVFENVGYYLLYNGILGDKRPQGGNILTAKILAGLPPHAGEKIIFGEGCRLSAERLEAEHITFRQIPYEIKAR